MQMRCIGLTLAALLVPAASAEAATVSVTGGHLVVTGAIDDRDAVGVADSSASSAIPEGVYWVVDNGSELIAGSGCHQEPGRTMQCDRAGVTDVTIDLGAGDDSGGATVLVPATVTGGPGADTISAPLSGVVDGGPGDDNVEVGGNGTRASIHGGSGMDALKLSDALPDRPGDPGSPEPGWLIRLDGLANDGPAGARHMNIPDDIEKVTGNFRADTLYGSDADNELNGGTGPDVLKGGGGDDTIDATDFYHNGWTSYSRDPSVYQGYGGWTDRVSCGPGYDRLIAKKAEDLWSSDCEHVVVQDVRDSPADPDDPYGSSYEVLYPVLVELNGDARANRLAGDPKIRNRILARGGDDRITGGPRRDSIDAGPGADSIRVKDGRRDVVRCGPGRDRVVADTRDRVGRDCEIVARRR